MEDGGAEMDGLVEGGNEMASLPPYEEIEKYAVL